MTKWQLRWWMVRCNWRGWLLDRAIGWAMYCPAWLRYVVTISACAKATTGQYGSDHPDDVSVLDLLQRIDPRRTA